jgi:hypothetical protein
MRDRAQLQSAECVREKTEGRKKGTWYASPPLEATEKEAYEKKRYETTARMNALMEPYSMPKLTPKLIIMQIRS